MDLPQSVIAALQQKYRPNSIKIFTFSLKKIFEEIDPQNRITFNPNHFLEFNKIKRFITAKKHKLTTQRNYISGLLAILSAYLQTIPEDKKLQEAYEKYQKLYDKINKATKKSLQYAEPTEAEKEDYIPFTEVIRIREEYAKRVRDLDKEEYNADELRLFQKYLLLSLYTYIPPLRGEEYINSLILPPSLSPKSNKEKHYQHLTQELNKNLIDIQNKKIVVAYYKTSGNYGLRYITIPKKLIEIIELSKKHNETNILLPNIQKLMKNIAEPITTGHLLTIFYSIFEPRQISTSMLRKIYISDYLSKCKDPSKRKKLAYQMGHSLENQEFIYSRFKKI